MKNADKTIEQLADEAYQEAKKGNMNFWTMPDDDPEVKYWKEVWIKGYKANEKAPDDSYDDPFYVPKNSERPAFPFMGEDVQNNGGLTKREAFAMAAMQGILANEGLREKLQLDMKHDGTNHDNYIAVYAVHHADELLKALSLLEESKPLNS